MENIVEGNLSTASRGGVPGTLSLIEAFFKVKRPPTNFKYEVFNFLLKIFFLIRMVVMVLIPNGLFSSVAFALVIFYLHQRLLKS
jgi:hypothetical protein